MHYALCWIESRVYGSYQHSLSADISCRPAAQRITGGLFVLRVLQPCLTRLALIFWTRFSLSVFCLSEQEAKRTNAFIITLAYFNTKHMCNMFYCLWVSIDAQALLCLTVGLVQSVPAVAGRSTPATGYGEPEAMPTIWPASPASPANGSCPQARSSGWWRRKYFVGSITTQWWRTWNGLLRAVRVSDAFRVKPYWSEKCF